jgi:hypothetical protein
LPSASAGRYACLCAPCRPYIPINEIGLRLNPLEPMIDRCRRYYAEHFDHQWHRLDRAEAFARSEDRDGDSRLMLTADAADSRVGVFLRHG